MNTPRSAPLQAAEVFRGTFSLKKKTAPLGAVFLFEWWASPESNRAPTDYAYHFSFRCPFRVRGLDCLLPLRLARTVSTPSLRSLKAWLGITTQTQRLPRI